MERCKNETNDTNAEHVIDVMNGWLFLRFPFSLENYLCKFGSKWKSFVCLVFFFDNFTLVFQLCHQRVVFFFSSSIFAYAYIYCFLWTLRTNFECFIALCTCQVHKQLIQAYAKLLFAHVYQSFLKYTCVYSIQKPPPPTWLTMPFCLVTRETKMI